jgi:hypothetical protein
VTTDTKDDLVTEEMVKAARAAYEQVESYEFCMIALEDALRAVAPMIAARSRYARTGDLIEAEQVARVAAEREACAKIADKFPRGMSQTLQAPSDAIAAAIRARGETQ